MNKKRHFLFTLIVAIMCVTMIFFAVACDKEPEPNPDPDTETNELFTNGEFTLFSGDNYPKSPNSWTSSSYSSSLTGSDVITSGVINTESKSYKNNKKTYGSAENPGTGSDKDTYILMIYNKKPTSYKYTSSTLTLDKNSYYKVSFKVKTNLEIDSTEDSSKQGAFVSVGGDAYASFPAINTDGDWKEFSVYIETSQIKSSSISLSVSLGKESDFTKGYAYFDNFVLENLSKRETPYTAADFKNQQLPEDGSVAKYSMLAGDSEFDATTGTSEILSAIKYTGKPGKGSGDESANSSSSYVDKGIYDTNKTKTIVNNNVDIALSKSPNAVGNKILVINNKKATAYGYQSDVAMRFAAGTYYKVTVDVFTSNIQSNGATIKLTNGKDNDDRAFVMDDVLSNNTWSTKEILVKANANRNTDLYLSLYLGQGGAKDTATHVQGMAAFDHITLEKVDQTAYDAAPTTSKYDLSSTGDIRNIEMTSDIFKDVTYDETIDSSRTAVVFADKSITITNNKPSQFSLSSLVKTENDGIEDNFKKFGKSITINPNNYYLLSMMVKTDNINKSNGLNISIVTIDEEGKDYATKVKTVSSLANLNSENLKDNMITTGIATGFTEVKFYIKGGILETNEIGLKFTLGTGKGTQATGKVLGTAIIKNINLEVITSSEYSSASSDVTTTTASFDEQSGSNEVSSNGEFKLIDSAATKELYKENEAITVFDENGKLKDKLGVPKGWSISDKAVLTAADTVNEGGVLDLDSTALTTKFGFDKDTFFAGNDILNNEDNKTALAIKTKSDKFGYSSESISLTANSYNLFTVWVKTSNVGANIELATKTGAGKDDINFINIDTNNKWEQFSFYVKTGVSSISVKLSLTVAPQGKEGWAFFDMAKYTTFPNEEAFNKASAAVTDHGRVQSWFIDSFDTTAPSSELSTPQNWNGGLIDPEAKSDSETLASGVFDITSGDWEKLGIDPDTKKDVHNAIFFPELNNPEFNPDHKDDNLVIGDSVLAIYNKKNTAYKYTSTSSITLKDDAYYLISIAVLTYGLEKDDTATITLKLNNQTYSFGKLTNDESTDIDKTRKVNTSTYAEDGTEKIGEWKVYNYYVHTEKDVKPSASISVGLGHNGEENWKDGYVFIDNFSVKEIEKESFIQVKQGQTEGEVNESLIEDATLIPNNHRIVLTSQLANAEENKVEPEPEKDESAPDKSKDLLWLWISSGIVGGVILLVLIVFLVKKFGKKKKKSFKSKK